MDSEQVLDLIPIGVIRAICGCSRSSPILGGEDIVVVELIVPRLPVVPQEADDALSLPDLRASSTLSLHCSLKMKVKSIFITVFQ